MRRLIYIAAFLFAVSLGTAFAQMRGSMGGHAGGFGRGGAVASRGFVGGGIGAHPVGLGRGSFAPRFFPRNSIRLRIGGFNPFFGTSFGFGPRFGFHRRAFFRNGFFANQFAFAGWPYYNYGWWGDPFYASNYYDTAQQNEDYRAQQVNADLQDLRNEVRDLREDNERYENRQPPISSERSRDNGNQSQATDAPATVLVFRDGHKVETRNYAIVGQTLWLFNEHRATKVPVSDLDVAATTAADEQRGIDFHLPKK